MIDWRVKSAFGARGELARTHHHARMTEPSTLRYDDLLLRARQSLEEGAGDRAIDDALVALATITHLPPSSERAAAVHDANLIIGQGFLGKGMERDAVRHLDRAVEADERSAVALRCRGQAKRLLDDHEGASVDLERAVALDEGSTEARLERGILRLRKKEWPGAVEDFTWVIERDATLRPRATYLRGSCFAGSGDDASSRRDLEAAIALDVPGSAVALAKQGPLDTAAQKLRLAKDYADREAFDDAIGTYHDVIATAGDDVALGREARIELGNLHRELGEAQEAVEAFSGAIELAPSDPRALALRGAALRRLSDDARACADFDRAIEIDPAFAMAYVLRGGLRVDGGDHEGAASDLERAIALSPKDSSAFLWRARLSKARGDDERARRDYFTAEELGARSSAERRRAFGDEKPDDYYESGSDALDRSAWKQAEEKFTQAIDAYAKATRVPGDYAHRHLVSCHSNRALARNQQDVREAAAADLEWALGQKPDYFDARINLANTYIALKRHDEARTQLAAAIALEPRAASAYYARARSFLDEERFKEAIADYSVAIDLGYDGGRRLADAYYNRAIAHKALGDLGAAIDDMTEAADLAYPDLRREIVMLQLQHRHGIHVVVPEGAADDDDEYDLEDDDDGDDEDDDDDDDDEDDDD